MAWWLGSVFMNRRRRGDECKEFRREIKLSKFRIRERIWADKDMLDLGEDPQETIWGRDLKGEERRERRTESREVGGYRANMNKSKDTEFQEIISEC
jgi:hypothetical protein